MKKLSVVIITKNEEKNIERCLKSVSWANEIVVVDSGSTDKTLEICNKFNCKIIETEWLGFGNTKKLAVDSAKHDWILSIDADEEVTDKLKNTIETILSQDAKYNGYRIKRQSFYVKQWIKHCGWDTDYPLRLFNKNYGNFNSKIVHESVELSGKIDKIHDYMLHYTYPDVATHIDKIQHYTTLGAEQSINRGKKVSIWGAIMHGVGKFLKMYLGQKGFLDGSVGFMLAINSAFGVYLKYIKIWEKSSK